MLATYMHETKIDDIRLRRSLTSIGDSQMFMYMQVSKWAESPRTQQDFCHLIDLESKNTCQEMLAYTLVKAIEDLEQVLGPYDQKTWQMQNLKPVRYEHPLGETPLRSYFEDRRSHAGGKRTPSMQLSFYHDHRDPYDVAFGSVFKSLFDLSEPTSAYFSLDVELNQSALLGKKKVDRGLVHIWENERYFRLPTWELADQIRFKLHETEESTFLHPMVIQEREEKPKGGCPFA